MSPACFTCMRTDVLSTMTNANWDILHLLLSAQVDLEHVYFANQKLLVCEKCADLLRDFGTFQEYAVMSVTTQIQFWDDMEAIKNEPVEVEFPTVFDVERPEMRNIGVNREPSENMVNTYGQISCDVKLEGEGNMEEELSYTELTPVGNDVGRDSGVPTPDKIFTTKDKKSKNKNKNKYKIKARDSRRRKRLPVYRTVSLTTKELYQRREEQRLSQAFTEAKHKCASCIEAFESLAEKKAHRRQYHQKKASNMKCRICKQTVPTRCLIEHVTSHHRRFECLKCEFKTNVLEAIWGHPCKKRKKHGRKIQKEIWKSDNIVY